jgi:Acyl-CoA carboxylase epsilon subunit
VSDERPGRRELTIVSGRPTAQETAAVVVVLSALASQPAPAPADRPAGSQWAARSRFLRPPLTPGPGAWRASALPR